MPRKSLQRAIEIAQDRHIRLERARITKEEADLRAWVEAESEGTWREDLVALAPIAANELRKLGV